MVAGRAILCALLALSFPGLVTSGKLLMFLMDGFRWDYLDIHGPLDKLTGFKNFINSGVKAEYMQSSFPTESMTNYFGLTTGLYPESNGMIANRMYDRERDAYLHLFELPNLRYPFWWDGAEPIWINAEKHSKPAHMYNWVGCEVDAHGINASLCVPHKEDSWENHTMTVRKGIQALKDDTADLIGVYIHNVDSQAHKYGALSSQVVQEVNASNDFMTFVMAELQDQRLVDDVDVMLFSDHGHTLTSPRRIINVTDLLNTDDVLVKIHQGSFVSVWPKPGKIGKVYSTLRNVHPNATAYLKADLPDRWHVRNHQRTPDIWLMADLGWSIIYNISDEDLSTAGRHGYDNNEPEMRGMFMASGPHFRNGVRAQPIRVVDVYQLMCHVLDLEPVPNNGTWSNVQLMLRDTRPMPILRASGWTNRGGIAIVLMCFCFAWVERFMS